MAATDRFFAAIKDVLLLTEEVKRLNKQLETLASSVEQMSNRIHDVDRRLVRIETMAEMTTQARQLPGPEPGQ